MALCKDPKTGKVESVSGNSCPTGWVTISTGVLPQGESTTSSTNPNNYYVPWPVQQGEKSPYVVPPLRYEASRAEAEWVTLPSETKKSITALAKSIDRRKTGQGLWREAVEAAKFSSAGGNPQTPFQMLSNIYRDYASGVYGAVGGSGRGSGSGGYAGPSRSVVVAAESDIRATADAVAMEMLGRGVSDEELQRIIRRTRSAERAQPQVTTSGPGMSVTEQGLTAEGRQDIVQNILAKKPEYAEFQKATTLMSWFDRALSERMQ